NNLPPCVLRFSDATSPQRSVMKQHLPELKPRINVVRMPRNDRAIITLGLERVAGTPFPKCLQQRTIARRKAVGVACCRTRRAILARKRSPLTREAEAIVCERERRILCDR